MKNLLLLIMITTVFSSCEKVIQLDLGNAAPTLVIESSITDQAGPYSVKLSRTVNFDDASVYPPVDNALVIIKDNTGVIDTLSPKTNGLYMTNKIIGAVGRTYSLTIVSEGKTYTAQTTMPQQITLDSLKYNALEFAGTTQHTVIPAFTDPIASGNNYRFLLKVNGVQDKSYIVDNDNVNNGKGNERPLFTNDIEIESGDTVNVEMQCIDAQAYRYYFTLAQAAGNGPGGGTTPSNPPNGITGGALGIFSAHTVQQKSIIIP